jgi:hypothetical protein
MVDWIPVNVAAESISEVLLSPARRSLGKKDIFSVYNIVNPRSIRWSRLVSMLQASSNPKLEVVSMTEWVSRLSTLSSTHSPDDLPGLKLLQFFENMAVSEGIGEERSKLFETEKARAISDALRKCKPFCQEWIESNLRVWRAGGFM